MPDEPTTLDPAVHASRPALLIAIIVAAELVAMFLNWGFAEKYSYLDQTLGLSIESLAALQLAIRTLSQGVALSAWWLAMLIPHSKRSVWVPLTLLVALTLVYSALPLYRAISNFYAWTVFGDALSRALAMPLAAISLQLVCIGGPCYLISRIGKLQLNRSGDLPQPITFGITRILGLTTLIAIAFAVERWRIPSDQASYTSGFSPAFFVLLSTISAVSLGIGWACLSWASASRSARCIAIAIAALVLLNSGTAYLTHHWLLQNAPDSIAIPMSELHLMISILYSLITCLAILATIRIAKYCGYELVLLPRSNINAQASTFAHD